jgi:hypothetical protein
MPHDAGQLQSSAASTAGGWFSGDPAEREVRTPIKGVRKVTAQAMVASAFTAPHVTEWVQVDVTATMDLVARLKTDREFKDVKVTPLTILAKAMCLAVKRNPGVNATWDEDNQEIVEKRYVNLGIAAATPRGLIVPNVKDADRMTLVELPVPSTPSPPARQVAEPGRMAAGRSRSQCRGLRVDGGTRPHRRVGDHGLRPSASYAVGRHRGRRGEDRAAVGHHARPVLRPPIGRR